jgi:adenylosuccinate synthase
MTARFMSGDQHAKDQLDRLAKKMAHVEDIEQHVAALEANYAVKQEAYHNIGMNTAADIDALFADSKLKKDNIKNSLTELKTLINEAKDFFQSASK